MSSDLARSLQDPGAPPGALVIGTEPRTRERIVEYLSEKGYHVRTCDTLEDGWDSYRNERIVLTQIPPGSNGEISQFVAHLRAQAAGSRPLVVLGIGNRPPEGGLMQSGLNDLIPEPIDLVTLESRLEASLRPDRPRPSPEGILGRILAGSRNRATAGAAGTAEAAPFLDGRPAGGRPVRSTATGSSGRGSTGFHSPFTPADPDHEPTNPFGSRTEVVGVAGGVPKPPGAAGEQNGGRDASVLGAGPESTPTPNGSAPKEEGGADAEALTCEQADPASAASEAGARMDRSPAGPPEALIALAEHTPLALAVFDREMRYLFANRRWKSAFHLENASLVGHSQYEIFPDLHPSWRSIYERCIQGRVERCDEDAFEGADGSQDWVRWEVRPWHDTKGAIGGVFICCEIITPHHPARRRARFETNLAQSLLEGDAPVLCLDAEGRIVRHNAAVARLAPCGTLVEQASPFWDQLLAGDERDRARDVFASRINPAQQSGAVATPAPAPESTATWRSTETLHLATGDVAVTWLDMLQRAPDGSPAGMLRVGIAVTPVEAEASRETSEASAPDDAPAGTREGSAAMPSAADARTAAGSLHVFDCAPIPTWQCDARGHLIRVNKAWMDLRGGGDSAEELGPRWLRSVHPDDRESVARAIADAINSRGPIRHSARILGADATPIRVVIRANPVLGPDDTFEGLAGVLEDDSSRDAFEQALQHLRDEASAARSGAESWMARAATASTEAEAARSAAADVRALLHKAREDAATAMAEAEAAKAEAGNLRARMQAALTELEAARTAAEAAANEARTAKAEAETAQRELEADRAKAEAANRESAAALAQAVVRAESAESAAAGAVRRTAADDAEGDTPTRCITENAPFGILLTDAEGRVLYANPQHARLLESSATEFESVEAWLADRCADATHAEAVREQWRDKVWRKQVRRVLPLINGDGLIREIEFRPTLLPDGRLILVLADVTETHRSTEALMASEARLKALTRECGIPLAAVDRTGDIAISSTAFDELLGLTALQVRRLRVDDCIEPEDRHILEDLRCAVEEGEMSMAVAPVPVRLRDGGGVVPSGSTVSPNSGMGSTPARRFRVQASRIADGEGNTLLVAFVFMPLTSATILPTTPGQGPSLPDGTTPALRSTDSGSTPAPAWNGAATPPVNETERGLQLLLEILQSQGANPETDGDDEGRARASLAAGHDRIRTLALVQRHTRPNAVGSMVVDLAACARDLADHHLGAADLSFEHLNIRTPKDPVPVAYGSAVPLALILNELLANAVRHAFPTAGAFGAVDVELDPPSSENDATLIALSVRDNGVGLPPGFSADTSTGAGLRIVRDLATRHGGRLDICNDDETEFRVTLHC